MSHRRSHLVSFGLVSLFAALALASSESPEEKEARKKKEAEALAELETYTKALGKAYEAVKKLDLLALTPAPCDAKAMLEKMEEEQRKRGGELVVVHLSFLQRFATDDKSAWKEDKSDWAWVNDSAWSGHFDKHPSERDAYAVNDTAKTMKSSFRSRRYMIVVAPLDAEAASLPKVPDEGAFESGVFEGWAFVIDQSDGTLTCRFRLEVENSDEVGFRDSGLFKEDPDKAVLKDFQDNFENALEKGLPKGISLGTGYGKILK